MIAAAAATGAVFAAIKLCAPAGDLYRAGLAAAQWPFRAIAAALADTALPALGRAHLTADPTDLIVLPALLVPVLLARRPRAAHRGGPAETTNGRRLVDNRPSHASIS